MRILKIQITFIHDDSTQQCESVCSVGSADKNQSPFNSKIHKNALIKIDGDVRVRLLDHYQ